MRISAPQGRLEEGGLAKVGMGEGSQVDTEKRRSFLSWSASAGMGCCQCTQLPAAQFCPRGPQSEGRAPDLSTLLRPCFPANESVFHLPGPAWEGGLPEFMLR